MRKLLSAIFLFLTPSCVEGVRFINCEDHKMQVAAELAYQNWPSRILDRTDFFCVDQVQVYHQLECAIWATGNESLPTLYRARVEGVKREQGECLLHEALHMFLKENGGDMCLDHSPLKKGGCWDENKLSEVTKQYQDLVD